MATWKKVITSGSDISQLNNDSQYLVSEDSGIILSGSFSGSFEGDGSGLTGVVGTISNSLTDGNGIAAFTYDGSSPVSVSVEASGSTLEVGTNGVRVADAGITETQLNTSVAGDGLSGGGGTALSVNTDDSSIEINGDILRVKSSGITNTMLFGSIANDKLVNDSITLGTTEVELGATAATIAGLTLTGAEATGSFTGSFAGNFVGTTDLPDLTDGNGIADFTYDGSTTATISVQADESTINSTAAGIKVADAGITATQINTSVAGTGIAGGAGTALSVDLTELTLGNGLDAGNATTLNLDLTEVIAGDAANRVLTSDGDGTLTAEANFLFDGSTLTVTGDQVISGDLTVQGTASFQNTENLLVADRFVLFASGSSTTGDGGIVVQQDTQDVGELFGYDSGTTRWAVDSAFDASNSAFTPEAFMAAVVEGTGTDPDATPARYDKKGNIFVGTDQEIWIYS